MHVRHLKENSCILRQKSWKIGRDKSILWSRPLNWLEPTVLMLNGCKCHEQVFPRLYPYDVIWPLAQTALDNFVHYTFCYFPVFYVIKAPGTSFFGHVLVLVLCCFFLEFGRLEVLMKCWHTGCGDTIVILAQFTSFSTAWTIDFLGMSIRG